MKLLVGYNYDHNIYIVTKDSFSEIPVGHCVINPSIVLHESYLFKDAFIFMMPTGNGYHKVIDGFHFAVKRDAMRYSVTSIIYYNAGKFRF